MSENWSPPPGWGPPSKTPSERPADAKAQRDAKSEARKVAATAKSQARKAKYAEDKAQRNAKSDVRKEKHAERKAERAEVKRAAAKSKADAEAALLVKRGAKLGSWGGFAGRSVVLYERCIEHGKSTYPIRGARASVESDGGVSIAKNRTLKTGLLYSKKTTVDTRVTYLTVETTEGNFVVSEKGNGSNARPFAARLNAQAEGLAPSASPQAAPSVADELAKLAQLRASGALTEAEFVSQKARLLR